MASSRFFVTNLPTDVTEKEIHKVFKKFGPVKLIELKSKENVLEPGKIVFAFVTLEINSDDAEYYLNDLNYLNLRGTKLTVSLAKESFIERLKRERAENEAGESNLANENDKTDEDLKKSDFLTQNVQNVRRVFNDDEDFDDDIDPDLMITKRRAGRSIQNGKIVIEESGAAPLHIIKKKKKIKNGAIDKKSSTAEQKRKESLHKMKNQYDEKKNAIQAALSGASDNKKNKIKFSNSEDEEDCEDSNEKKPKLFGSDDEANEEDINTLKVQYGKKGEKLAELQSHHQNIDQRFKMDEKFVDLENVDENENKEETEQVESNEREWQLNILEQVVGFKLDTDTAAQKAAKNKKMLRFDPSKTEHEKLLRHKAPDNDEEVQRKGKKESKKSSIDEKSTAQTKAPAVSKEVFYVVSDTLTKALKTRGEGFSLLNMFGNQSAVTELEKREEQIKELKDERILVNKLNKNSEEALNYESSSSGEDDADAETKNDNSAKITSDKKTKNPSKSKIILKESFFIYKGDARLKEGAKFFIYNQSEQIAEEDYEPVRRRLNMLIKKKVIKTKKNLTLRKSKRNKKKFSAK